MNSHRESFASSVSRTRGAERLAEEDARRRVELDSLTAEWRLEATEKRLLAKLPARARRDRRKKTSQASYPPRHATQTTGTVSGAGEGI